MGAVAGVPRRLGMVQPDPRRPRVGLSTSRGAGVGPVRVGVGTFPDLSRGARGRGDGARFGGALGRDGGRPGGPRANRRAVRAVRGRSSGGGGPGLSLGPGDPGGADLGLQCPPAGGRGVGHLDGPARPGLLPPLAGRHGPGASREGVGPAAPGGALELVLRPPDRGRGDQLRADALRALGDGPRGVGFVGGIPPRSAGVAGVDGLGLPVVPGPGDLAGGRAIGVEPRPSPGRIGSGAGFATTGASSGPCACRSGSIARPTRASGRRGSAGSGSNFARGPLPTASRTRPRRR